MMRVIGQRAATVGMAVMAAGVSGGALAPVGEVTDAPAAVDPRDNASPFGMSSSAEWMSQFPRFMPMAAEAGATWFRVWPEWSSLQPRPGAMRWGAADRMVVTARSTNGRMLGILFYLAPWASADGKSSRAFPIRDIDTWRHYVRETLTRYRGQIRYWEVWNEYNSPAFNQRGTAADYAQLVREAHAIARSIDPSLRIGISCANFDVQFLDDVIKAGAADHFDFVAVHPYEAFGAVLYGEVTAYLGQAQTLRRMLAANNQPAEMPLWITEAGDEAPVKPDAAADQRQAEAVVKLYTLSTAQGFARTFWFEARGPAYGSGTDFGLIREDWSLRPAWYAYRTMTQLLGAAPRFVGWIRLGEAGYGFVFEGRAGHVLVAWGRPGTSQALSFAAPVRVTSLAGDVSPDVLEASLSAAPIFITGVPDELLEQARANSGKAFTFDGDYADAEAVTCRFDPNPGPQGLRQIWFRKDTEGRTIPAEVEGEACLKAISGDKDKHAAYFRIDPSFAGVGDHALEITVVARRAAPDSPATIGLKYESTTRVNDYFLRYRPAEQPWTIPAEPGWHAHTWQLTDAHFLGQWGWNFALSMQGETREFLIKEVRVTRGG